LIKVIDEQLVHGGSSIKVEYIQPKASAPAIGYNTPTTAGFIASSGDSGDSTSTIWWEAVSLIAVVNT
jgi:hypothetical protein